MATSSVQFEMLDKFLASLGFKRSEVCGPQFRFEHPPSGAVLLYPAYEPTQDVETRHIGYTRATLDLSGVMERSEFDEQLRQRVLAG
jgi:hypothetical protein